MIRYYDFKYTVYSVNHKTFVIMFMLQKIVFTFIMSLVMVAINKVMDYFICKNYLLHHNENYYYNK